MRSGSGKISYDGRDETKWIKQFMSLCHDSAAHGWMDNAQNEGSPQASTPSSEREKFIIRDRHELENCGSCEFVVFGRTMN